MAKLISNTYGEALFELALEENKIDAIGEEVEVVQTAIGDNADLIKLLTHPRVGDEEKISVIKNIFEGKVSEELLNFMLLLSDKNRFGEIDKIFTYFLDKVRENKNIGVARVTSAKALTEAQKEQISKRLLEVTSYDKIDTRYEEDASLIGGIVIRIGDRVVDGSIRSQLDRMEKTLSSIQLK